MSGSIAVGRSAQICNDDQIFSMGVTIRVTIHYDRHFILASLSQTSMDVQVRQVSTRRLHSTPSCARNAGPCAMCSCSAWHKLFFAAALHEIGEKTWLRKEADHHGLQYPVDGASSFVSKRRGWLQLQCLLSDGILVGAQHQAQPHRVCGVRE